MSKSTDKRREIQTPPGEDSAQVDFNAAASTGQQEGPGEGQGYEGDPDGQAAAPPEPPETCKEYLRRNFTPEECLILGAKMSQAYMELAKVNEDLASIKADFKGRITNLEGEVSNYSRMLNAGYEMTNVDCVVTRDHDRKMVIITRMDTGEFVRERKMTIDELQRPLLPPETPQSPEDLGAHFGVPAGEEAAAAPPQI